MKAVNRIILALIIALLAGNVNLCAQTNSFYVYFKQKDKKMNIKKAEVHLLKEPFKIYVEYTARFDLLVHASVKNNVYKDAADGKLLFALTDQMNKNEPLSFFKQKHVIETDHNNCRIWKKDDSDCDSIQKIGDRYLSVKNVDKLDIEKEIKGGDDGEGSASSFQINEMKDDLYLIFIYAEKQKNGDIQEVQREVVKVKWVKAYDEDTKKYQREKKRKDKSKVREAKAKLKYKQRIEKKGKKAIEKLEKKKEKDTKGKEENTDKEK
jgi:hypothetical protein